MATIFCKELLFLHIQKTGGTSVTRYLKEVLPPPLYLMSPRLMGGGSRKDLVHIPGKGHQTLQELTTILPQYGFDIHTFPMIMAVLRNPYDLIVSHYSYLRRPNNLQVADTPLYELAMNSSFHDFVVSLNERPRSLLSNSGRFVFLGEDIPSNVRFLKFEKLGIDVKDALTEIGIETDNEFPWLNKSPHAHYASYYDRDTEAIVYARNKWIFERGYFERMTFDEGGPIARESVNGAAPAPEYHPGRPTEHIVNYPCDLTLGCAPGAARGRR